MAVRDIAPLPQAGIALECHEVHTVIAERGAAWLIVEGELAPLSQQSRCYSRRNTFELPENLYRSMDSWQMLSPDRLKLLEECGEVLWHRRDMDEEVQA